MKRKKIITFILIILIANISFGDPNKDLLNAAKKGDIKKVQEALQKGANVNAKENGLTALMMASFKGHTEVVKLLIGAKADVNVKMINDSRTALKLASREGHKEIVNLLKQAGAK